MKSGIVLLYNCSAPGFSKLKQIFAMLKLRMRVVTPDKYHLTLLDLAEGTGEAGEAGETIPESMLVFCGLNGAFLNQVLEVIRVAKLPPIQFKAVMTEDNKQWNSLQLVEELRREKEALEAEQK